MTRLGWSVVILGLYLLHQDVWLWTRARPLAFGFLPIGLAYHGAYCLAVALLMWALTRYAWPGQLELEDAAFEDAALARDKGQGTRDKGQGSRDNA